GRSPDPASPPGPVPRRQDGIGPAGRPGRRRGATPGQMALSILCPRSKRCPVGSCRRAWYGSGRGSIVRPVPRPRPCTGCVGTPTVHGLLRRLNAAGFDGAPRVFGYDERGREIVEFLQGAVPWPGAHFRLLGEEGAVRRVGQLLRSFHDAVSAYRPDGDAVWRFPEMQADALPFVNGRGLLVCHDDPAAWTLVIGPHRWAFIDWDAAGPRPPIWDVAYCAAGIVPISSTPAQLGWTEPVPVVPRLRALAGGYGLESEE